ncbi:c-type cytochrome [Parahaliea mediterranea]|uniref:c-type cytochrome n=1 Tax=Parahaliea mediterranea TaxID=651086 RepID=UPI000E2EB21D|nr:c-type cytochrome [Parahaliea mediterranea]
MFRTLTLFAALLVAAAASAVELSESQRAAIEERIAPMGEVCLQGDSSCGGPAVAASSGPRSGKEVFDAACMACHTTGAGGAPVLGDVDAWAPRIAKGMDTLHKHGLEGIPGTGMMAKGGCVNCSDDEVIAAVDYMVEGSQ